MRACPEILVVSRRRDSGNLLLVAIVVLGALACGSGTDTGVVARPESATKTAEDAGGAAVDSDTRKEIAEAEAADTAEALAILKVMSDFLASKPALAYESEAGWDSMQVTGQRLEFGAHRQVTVRRPDRGRMDSLRRDGETSTLYFDGKHIWIDLPDDDAYVSVEKPGSLDDAIDYLRDDLDIPVPLADLVRTNLYAALAPRVKSGFWVGESTFGDETCDHIALRFDTGDVQLWIEQGDRPVPHRVVITYRDAPGTPQFWAQLDGWNFSPDVSDARFSYTPPSGASKIPVRTALDIAKQEASNQ